MYKNASEFDHCNLTNIKLYLNFEFYPYDESRSFDKDKYISYDMYTRFAKFYYGYDYLETYLSRHTFANKGSFMITDCSQQNEFIKSATVDVRLEFECKKNVLVILPPIVSSYMIE